MLTFGELSRYLGVDRNTVLGWADCHGLPYTSKITRKIKHYYFVDSEDFWKWASDNKEKINFGMVKENVILPDPEWVKKKRYYNANFRKRTCIQLTCKKDGSLKKLIAFNGYIYRKTRELLGRSPVSMEIRYSRL